jgi:hypothetical protein
MGWVTGESGEKTKCRDVAILRQSLESRDVQPVQRAKVEAIAPSCVQDIPRVTGAAQSWFQCLAQAMQRDVENVGRFRDRAIGPQGRAELPPRRAHLSLPEQVGQQILGPLSAPGDLRDGPSCASYLQRAQYTYFQRRVPGW